MTEKWTALWRWLPAYSLLNPELESQYRISTSQEQRRNETSWVCAISVLLGIFLAVNLNKGGEWFEPVNIKRILAIMLMLFNWRISRTASDLAWRHSWFLSAIVFCGLTSAILYESSLASGVMTEGRLLLCLIGVGYLNFFHFGEKCLLWSVLLIGPLAATLDPLIHTGMTLLFAALTLLLLGMAQYQNDIIMRERFVSQLNERMRAETDQLTGAMNRYALDRHISNVLTDMRAGETLTLALLDIDYFKQYNDNYGHLDGDKVLMAVAKALKQQRWDIVVRFGGEEFIGVKRHHGRDIDWIPQLAGAIAALNIPHAYSPYGCVTVSAGIFSMTKQGPSYPDQAKSIILSEADRLLYQAKDKGRNQVVTGCYETLELPAQAAS